MLNVLAFFAHPDDETMLAGGTLALLASSGAQVYYLMATRGEGGEIGEPPVCDRKQLGEVRAAELACAVQALGGRELIFMDYVDPTIGEGEQMFSYTSDLQGLSDRVAGIARQLEIGAILTHGSNGEYGHPAHVTTYQAARRAVESLFSSPGITGPLLYTVSAAFPEHPKPRLSNPSDPAHLVLDISPVLDQKIRAALCHRSQNALFVRSASEEAGRKLGVPEVIVHLESLHRAFPIPEQALDDPLAKRIKPWVISQLL